MSAALWLPSEEYIQNSNLYRFKQFVETNSEHTFVGYRELYDWSVQELESFWEYIFRFFEINYSGSYDRVLDWNREAYDFIDVKWFEGISLNYAEHVFGQADSHRAALKFGSEHGGCREVSWLELSERVSVIQQFLLQKGVGMGDRVVGVLNNTVETVAVFLAANSLGAVWSCCSPDFGDRSVLERFSQVAPKVLFMETRYRYNDKEFSKVETQRVLRENIESLETVVDLCSPEWEALLSAYVPREITFMRVPFSHPLWILYSSGTTGNPKAITHSVGGNLLEHYKALALQQNVQEGDNFLWYTTTGWMMWNYALSALLCGATLCLYDGAIHHASHRTFWTFLQRAEVDHLGAGAAYYSSLHDFSIEGYAPKVIGSTGSPLPVATFENLQEKFPQTHIISLSGGTDVCSAFLSGSAMLPVYAGQLQCRALGAAIEALNDDGQAVYDEVGELVIEKPMPSMPIYFWNDKGNVKYHESYFEKFPRVWSHGDWIKIIRDEGIIIYGRSDATLNRGGVRIGTAEVYNAINGLEGIMDSLVICIEQVDGSSQMLLFVKLAVTQVLDETLRNKIKTQLRSTYSPRHVPDVICEVQDIPYTLSGKKLELPIKKLFMGHDIEKVVSKDVLRNPDCLHEYAQLRDRLKL